MVETEQGLRLRVDCWTIGSATRGGCSTHRDNFAEIQLRRYYLDSHALSNCLGFPHLNGWTTNGSKLLRAAIADGIDQGRIAALGSQYHLEEASRIPSTGATDARRRFLDFFWSTVKWLLLLPTHELVVEEAAAKGRLELDQPFDTVYQRMVIKQQCRSGEKLDELATSVEAFVQKFAVEQSARKRSLIAKFRAMNTKPSKATKEWWSGADAQIEEWVTDYMAASAEYLGLQTDRALWPTARSQQTAWAMHSCLMARVVLNLGSGWEVDDGDLHDAHHYASACYADAFVVQDRGSRETLKLIPGQPVQLLSFDEFALELGITPH